MSCEICSQKESNRKIFRDFSSSKWVNDTICLCVGIIRGVLSWFSGGILAGTANNTFFRFFELAPPRKEQTLNNGLKRPVTVRKGNLSLVVERC